MTTRYGDVIAVCLTLWIAVGGRLGAQDELALGRATVPPAHGDERLCLE